MHELSLVQNLLEQVTNLMREHGAAKVTAVSVVIGPFSGVVAESFAFAFEALKKDDPALACARLELDRPAPRYLCLDCGGEAEIPLSPEQPESRCPACDSPKLSPLGGTELVLRQIRME